MVNTPPTLEIRQLSNGRIQLSWPTEPSGFNLESNNNLATNNWVPVTGTPRVSDAYNRVEMLPMGGKKFFRLKK